MAATRSADDARFILVMRIIGTIISLPFIIGAMFCWNSYQNSAISPGEQVLAEVWQNGKGKIVVRQSQRQQYGNRIVYVSLPEFQEQVGDQDYQVTIAEAWFRDRLSMSGETMTYAFNTPVGLIIAEHQAKGLPDIRGWEFHAERRSASKWVAVPTRSYGLPTAAFFLGLIGLCILGISWIPGHGPEQEGRRSAA